MIIDGNITYEESLFVPEKHILRIDLLSPLRMNTLIVRMNIMNNV